MYTQGEQCRQHHLVWEPGGDPHLPAGAVCGFGGLHQVSHAGHGSPLNLLSQRSQWRAIIGPQCTLSYIIYIALQVFHKAYFT